MQRLPWSYGGESGEVVVEGGYVQGPEAAVDGRPHTGRVDLVEYDGFTLAVPRIWGPTLTPRVWTTMMAAKASYAQEVDPLISRGMVIATLGMAYGISFGALPRYSVAVQAPGLARAAPSSAAGGGGGRGANHLKPDPNAQGAHSTFKRDPTTGKVTGHAEWQPNPRNPSGFDQAKRVDTQYANPHTHHNKATGQQVPTPHAHDKSAPGGVRPARPDELPR